MSEGLSIAYLLWTIGTFQFMLGLVCIAGNAWKANPVMAVLTIIFPPAAMYWALGPYKRAADDQWQAMFVAAMYHIGLAVFVLAMWDVYVHSANLAMLAR